MATVVITLKDNDQAATSGNVVVNVKSEPGFPVNEPCTTAQALAMHMLEAAGKANDAGESTNKEG